MLLPQHQGRARVTPGPVVLRRGLIWDGTGWEIAGRCFQNLVYGKEQNESDFVIQEGENWGIGFGLEKEAMEKITAVLYSKDYLRFIQDMLPQWNPN